MCGTFQTGGMQEQTGWMGRTDTGVVQGISKPVEIDGGNSSKLIRGIALDQCHRTLPTHPPAAYVAYTCSNAMSFRYSELRGEGSY